MLKPRELSIGEFCCRTAREMAMCNGAQRNQHTDINDKRVDRDMITPITAVPFDAENKTEDVEDEIQGLFIPVKHHHKPRRKHNLPEKKPNISIKIFPKPQRHKDDQEPETQQRRKVVE